MMPTHFVLVKHGESDFRLHRRDGTETGHTWEHSPDAEEIHRLGVPQGCFCFRQADDLDEFDWSVTA
jgi:hypothetical protein